MCSISFFTIKRRSGNPLLRITSKTVRNVSISKFNRPEESVQRLIKTVLLITSEHKHADSQSRKTHILFMVVVEAWHLELTRRSP